MSVSVGDGVSLTLVQPNIYRGAVQPPSARIGDMWVDTSVGAILKRCTSISPITFEAVDTAGGGSQASLQFKDEGTNLGATGTVDTVDVVGAGATATRVGNVVTITIPGGGGGVSDGTYGDITVSGTGTVWTIVADSVTFAKMQNIATSSFIGRITAAAGDPENLTAAQATSILNQFTSVLQGVVPASTGGTVKYLRADASWTVPPDTTYSVFTNVAAGLAPASGGGAVNYLRADGSWQTPPDTTYAVFTAGANGLAPLSGGGVVKYLRADGSWQIPPDTTYGVFTAGANGLAPLSGGGSVNYLRADGSWQPPPGTTYSVFTAVANGLAPLSGGGTTNFLRADGTWQPPGGGPATVSISSTTPVIPYGTQDASITITDASVTATSKVMLVPGMFSQTGTNHPADATVSVESVAVGSFVINVVANGRETLGGPFQLYYLLG